MDEINTVWTEEDYRADEPAAKINRLRKELESLETLAHNLAGAELNYRCALSDAGYHRTPEEALELLRQAGGAVRDCVAS